MRRILFSLIALALLVGLAGCSTAEADSVKVGPDAIVLDVRTPQEFAAGHLEGAELLDLLRRDDQHVALLRLVAPDLARRHARLVALHLAQVDTTAR